MIKKLIKNFRSIPSDIIKIIKNRNQIIYGNLPLYLKYKYFKEEWEGNKIDSMVYFNIVNYYIYDNNYIVDKLKSYWKKYRLYDETLNFIVEDFNSLNDLKMLDIGCGLTSILNIIDFGKKYGVDIGVHKLSKKGFNLNKDICWIAGDGEYLPFENDSLDIVFSTNSLDHIPHPKKCLKEIKRVLKHNGLFFLIIDIFSKDRGYRNKKHPNSFTSEEIKKMLSDFKIFKEIAMDEEPVGVSNYINSKQKRKSKSVKKDNKTSLFLICTNSPTK